MTTTNSRQSGGRSPFGELLVRFRTERGLTQELLAANSKGARISARSITSYEAKAESPQKWVLPHRPALRVLSEALELDMVDQHRLAVAWNTSRKLRDAPPSVETQAGFVTAGREDVVRIIMDAWQHVRSGTPQVVLLGGISGIGKTALTRHVSDLIAASTNNVLIAWGGASGWVTEVEPYLAVRTATDRLLVKPDASSTLPGDYPSRPTLGPNEIPHIIESIPKLGGALMSEWALREMATHLGTEYTEAIGAMLATRAGTQTTGRYVEYSRLLIQLSQSWPIVMVLEDLHWAGEQTSTLVTHLAAQLQNVRNTPILILCTYRNDELQSRDNIEPHPFIDVLDSISHLPHVSMVTLNESMSPTAGMAFVRGVVDQTPMTSIAAADELADYLYEHTSGHPLLTSELKRHLLETGALAQNKEREWEFDANRIPARTPAAISTFIAQRLKRVSSRGRRILEIASVMDDVILAEIIAETMEADVEDILEVINHELNETHQLLLPATQLRVLRQTYSAYRFPHAHFREHIYNGLPQARRKRIHLSIAQAMERQYTEADTTALGEITSHYMMAEDWHSAQIASYRLAQEATYKLDWDLASTWFPQAESLAIQAQDPQQLWRARAARLAMMRGTGQLSEAVELGERILKLADVHNWPNTLALTYHHLGEVYYDLGEVDTAVDYLQRAIKLHMQEGALDLAAAGEAMLSHSTYRQGKYDVAREHAQNALEISKQTENSWVPPEAVLAAANCEIDLGFYEQAIENYTIARELASMVGKLQNQYIPAINIGLSYTFMGDHQRAIDELSSLLEELESLNMLRLVAPARLYLGYAHEAVGNLEAAAESYRHASEIRRTFIPYPPLYDSLAGEMRIALSQGKVEEAKALLDEITTYLDENGWEGIEYPLIVKVGIARTYQHFVDLDGYALYIQRAHMLLMQRAGMIADPTSRESFLTNVPIAVEVQELYAGLNTNSRKQ